MARSALLPLLVCSKPFIEQIYQRIAKMYNEIYKGFNGKMLLLLKTITDFRMMGLIYYVCILFFP